MSSCDVGCLALAEGIPITDVSRWLGHNSIEVTTRSTDTSYPAPSTAPAPPSTPPTAVCRAGRVAQVTDPHKWVIHGERLVDDTPHIRVSLADVELPNQVRFTQYVFRMRRCAMTVVLDDAGDRVLLMRRHRFIVDRWVWELPGGYVDDCEDSGAAAAREVEEETGWTGTGVRAERVGEPEVDGTAEVRWVPVDETSAMIAGGEIPSHPDFRCRTASRRVSFRRLLPIFFADSSLMGN